MKFYVDYFGCRANQAEIQEWITELEEEGYQLTKNVQDAKFGILNTCSVTEKAEKDIYKFINRVYKNTDIKWLITGCTISQNKEKLESRYKNYLFYDNIEKQNLVEEIKGLFPTDDTLIYHSAFRSRIFLKIHDGCNFRCSYCIVPALRGKAVSLPAEIVEAKARYFVSLGYREIVLTGINLSSYGYDLFPRENLFNLVKRLDKIKSLSFLRLSSLDPRYIKYNNIKELSYLRKLAHSFHFSFQSASDSVLKRMKRGSKASDYRRIMDYFQRFFPDANFGADILTGFPGETDREYQETINFVRETGLNYIHIFPYSPREGTKAALLEQVPSHIVQKRAQELKEANKLMRINYRERFRGKVLPGILTEEDENYCMVVTTNFLSVRVPPIKGFKKRRVKVRITRILNENICEGRILK